MENEGHIRSLDSSVLRDHIYDEEPVLLQDKSANTNLAIIKDPIVSCAESSLLNKRGVLQAAKKRYLLDLLAQLEADKGRHVQKPMITVKKIGCPEKVIQNDVSGTRPFGSMSVIHAVRGRSDLRPSGRGLGGKLHLKR